MTEISHARELLQKKTLRDIRSRYIVAVLMIAAFLTLTFAVDQTMDRKMKEDFKTINLSGRQRMLSQRIALLTLRGDSEALRDAKEKFQSGLDFLLQSRFVNPKYPEIYDTYKDENGLEQQSNRFLALSPENKEEVFALSQELLRKYEKVTFLKQYISEEEFTNNILLEIFILIVCLFILGFEVRYIFQPMLNRVKETFDELNDIEEKSYQSSRLALIGEIASGIGHEIKNPLFVLKHFASKIENQHAREQIEKNADRISRILKALSTQAREASEDAMEPAPLKSIIDDAVEMFEPKMRYGNIELKRDLKFDGEIKCRHAAISQVIANLISNAIDAVSENSTDKKISIESGQDAEGIFVRVIDSGPGVPVGLEDKIFESFITTKKEGKGTGLGLPISKKIMQDHHGSLGLNTKISASCFELRFPN